MTSLGRPQASVIQHVQREIIFPLKPPTPFNIFISVNNCPPSHQVQNLGVVSNSSSFNCPPQSINDQLTRSRIKSNSAIFCSQRSVFHSLQPLLCPPWGHLPTLPALSAHFSSLSYVLYSNIFHLIMISPCHLLVQNPSVFLISSWVLCISALLTPSKLSCLSISKHVLWISALCLNSCRHTDRWNLFVKLLLKYNIIHKDLVNFHPHKLLVLTVFSSSSCYFVSGLSHFSCSLFL